MIPFVFFAEFFFSFLEKKISFKKSVNLNFFAISMEKLVQIFNIKKFAPKKKKKNPTNDLIFIMVKL
jgi:hypothetical protein